MLMLAIKPYPHIRSLVCVGAKGYYIDRGGYINITLPDELVECEFPGAEAYDELPPDFRLTFRREWEEDFRRNLAASLIRSDLSDPPAPAAA